MTSLTCRFLPGSLSVVQFDCNPTCPHHVGIGAVVGSRYRPGHVGIGAAIGSCYRPGRSRHREAFLAPESETTVPPPQKLQRVPPAFSLLSVASSLGSVPWPHHPCFHLHSRGLSRASQSRPPSSYEDVGHWIQDQPDPRDLFLVNPVCHVPISEQGHSYRLGWDLRRRRSPLPHTGEPSSVLTLLPALVSSVCWTAG